MKFQWNTTFKMSAVKVSSTAHNDGDQDRLAENLQQIERLNSHKIMLPGQQQSPTRFCCVQCKRANGASAVAASFPLVTKVTCKPSFRSSDGVSSLFL